MRRMSEIGLIGLGTMGQNLALNLSDKNFKVSVYNRTTEKMKEFVEKHSQNINIAGFECLKDFIDSLMPQKIVILMIKSGEAVDAMIEALIEHLSDDDVIIDGGNSFYKDTEQRIEKCWRNKIHFVAAGISGGEEGARYGPSIMLSGNFSIKNKLLPIFQKIAATYSNEPCASWLGQSAQGHFVKMIHNGIEYSEMQSIAESYQILKNPLQLTNIEMAEIFQKWNQSKLNSYLMEITSKILKFKNENGDFLLNKIVDKAGEKGTGKWSIITGLELGVPTPSINSAVSLRLLSNLKSIRSSANKIYGQKNKPLPFFYDNTQLSKNQIIKSIENALYCTKIINFAQGFYIFQKINKSQKWQLDLKEIAKIWRNGCIIKNQLLNLIVDAFDNNSELENLILDPVLSKEILECLNDLKIVCCFCIWTGVPASGFLSALSYLEALKENVLPTNLIQAMRDYFGSHMFEIEGSEGMLMHSDWKDV